MRAMAKPVLIVIASIVLSACTTYWDKAGSSPADLQRDAYECERDARQSGPFDNAFFMLAFQERCMMARGWTKTSADGTPR